MRLGHGADAALDDYLKELEKDAADHEFEDCHMGLCSDRCRFRKRGKCPADMEEESA